MHRTSLSDSECPVARSLDQVGDWWSILILRDAAAGLSRFDEFAASLGAAPNMLARRLAKLVEVGCLARRRYSDRPPRHEYVLTDKGRDFYPVLAALLGWGNRWLAPEGPAMLLVDRASGAPIEPVVADARTGRPIALADTLLAAGPAAGEEVSRRVAQAAAAVSLDDGRSIR